MLRETIQVSTQTDVEAVVSRMREKFVNVGMAPIISDPLLQQITDLVQRLIEQGNRIAAIGGQMEVTRDLKGDGYSIRIVFQEGLKKSFTQKLFDRLRAW